MAKFTQWTFSAVNGGVVSLSAIKLYANGSEIDLTDPAIIISGEDGLSGPVTNLFDGDEFTNFGPTAAGQAVRVTVRFPDAIEIDEFGLVPLAGDSIPDEVQASWNGGGFPPPSTVITLTEQEKSEWTPGTEKVFSTNQDTDSDLPSLDAGEPEITTTKVKLVVEDSHLAGLVRIGAILLLQGDEAKSLDSLGATNYAASSAEPGHPVSVIGSGDASAAWENEQTEDAKAVGQWVSWEFPAAVTFRGIGIVVDQDGSSYPIRLCMEVDDGAGGTVLHSCARFSRSIVPTGRRFAEIGDMAIKYSNAWIEENSTLLNAARAKARLKSQNLMSAFEVAMLVTGDKDQAAVAGELMERPDPPVGYDELRDSAALSPSEAALLVSVKKLSYDAAALAEQNVLEIAELVRNSSPEVQASFVAFATNNIRAEGLDLLNVIGDDDEKSAFIAWANANIPALGGTIG